MSGKESSLLPNDRYLIDKLSNEIIERSGLKKTARQVLMLEVEAWGDSLTVAVPPEAKGKRVRLRVEVIE